ncbi:MAG: hypothetical protein Q8Q42_03215 [Nanoarchaeota archaeon]|nr:hypothetical protein [Nanoarchaeota archaeon]
MDSLKCRKGILITLGMVFISLTILSFANVILKNSENSESRIKEFAETERVYNLRSSISKSMERMKDEIMAGYLDISYKNGIVEFKTKFTGKPVRPEVEIIQQMEIFNKRLRERYYVDFENDKFPMVDDKGVLIEYEHINSLPDEDGDGLGDIDLINQINITKFYLKENNSMYVGYSSWPYNVIYLNGFNNVNIREINFTYKSETNYPHVPLLKNDTTGAYAVIPAVCNPNQCITFTFNNYHQGVKIYQESFYVKASSLNFPAFPSLFGTSNYPSPNANVVVGSASDGYGYHPLFQLNISKSIPDDSKNRTIIFNWVHTSAIDYIFGTPTDRSTSGMMILFPELKSTPCVINGLDNTDEIFDWLFYGLVQRTTTSGCGRYGNFPPLDPEDVINIEIQIIMKDDFATHYGGLESAKSYSLNLPFIETGGKNITIEYSGQ